MSTELLKGMMEPSLYEHSTSSFTLLETHASWVLLTGDYVYKIKKPMNFGFLDYSSLEKRKKYCEMEVKLNCRLAPDLYEDVVPISGSESSPRLNDDSNIIEYAIRMKQFPVDAVFEKMYEEKKLPKQYLLTVACQLARFHEKAEQSSESSSYGCPEHIWFPVNQNFEQIRPLLTDSKDLDQLNIIETWATREFEQHKAIMLERKKRGFIKACHGDVHLGNIALFENEVTLFDGIEFNEDFRWTDTMADLGFLVMDLESKGLKDYAAAVIDCYMEYSGDCCGLALLDFYKSYRAMVKAKVALFRLYSEGISESDKQQIYSEYRHYVNLAEQYCTKNQPVLLITNGLSGSGKSTVSHYIVDRLRAIRLRSDIERKRLFGLKGYDSSRELDEDIYTKEANQKTYKKLLWLARNALNSGYSVIVDSAALKENERSIFSELAEQTSVPFVIVRCQAPEKELAMRVDKRQKVGFDASEATVDILGKQKKWEEPLTQNELKRTVQVNISDVDWQKVLVKRVFDLV